LCVGLTSTWASAQVNFTGTYSENFNSLGATATSPPPGWTAGFLGPSRVTDGGGAVTPDVLTVDDGSNDSVGRNLNYGVIGDSDRALGSMGTTATGGDRVTQLALLNNTGGPLTQLTLGYTGEQWRINQGTPSAANGTEKIRFLYSLSPSSGWVPLGEDYEFFRIHNEPAETAINGNLTENRTLRGGTFFLDTPVPLGQTLYLRWLDWNDDATADHGLAIDDVSITAPVVPEPAGVSLAIFGALAWVARRRSRA